MVKVSPGKSVSADYLTAGPSGLLFQQKRNAKRKLNLDAKSSLEEDPDEPSCKSSSEDEAEPAQESDQESQNAHNNDITSTVELEEGSFVIVRYLRKKAPYHFVGKVLHKAAEDENSWLIHYYRCCFDVSSSHLSFKQPENPDISATLQTESQLSKYYQNVICKRQVVLQKGHW